MDTALLIARLLLALVFLTAALTKFADRPGTRQAMLGFGAPQVLVGPLGLLLPLAELAIAVALIPTQWTWGAAIAALVLLGLFIAGIVVNLVRGRRPDCHCFGQIYSKPIGVETLVRNGALAAVAAFIIVEGRNDAGTSATTWVTTLAPAEVVDLVAGVLLLALLATQWWFLMNLLRMNGRLLQRIEVLEVGTPATAETSAPQAPAYGLPVGSVAPAFALSGLYGETMTLEALRAREQPILLLFTSPSCGPCSTLMPDIGRWQKERDDMTVALVSAGTTDENRAKSKEHGISVVLLQKGNEVAEAYKSPGTPSAVIVGADGRIFSPLVAGPEAIRDLVASIRGGNAAKNWQQVPLLEQAPAVPDLNGNGAHPLPGASRIGQAAPPIRLRDVHGKMVNLSDFEGSKTMVLFWDTDCGFCRKMLPDLKEWERTKPKSAPKILMVSTGPEKDVKALSMRSPLVRDSDGSVGREYGAGGTPMAVLVDEKGEFASEVVAGAAAVLALATGDVAAAMTPPAPTGQKGTVAAAIGQPAPPIELPGASGGTVRLADMQGKPTLVLFWNTGCGFCQRMLPDLKAWERSRPAGSPEILMVSAGPDDAVQAMGLRSTVALDPNFSVSNAYGASGTPMAVLVDAAGKIASQPVAGADAVLKLAGAGAVVQA